MHQLIDRIVFSLLSSVMHIIQKTSDRYETPCMIIPPIIPMIIRTICLNPHKLFVSRSFIITMIGNMSKWNTTDNNSQFVFTADVLITQSIPLFYGSITHYNYNVSLSNTAEALQSNYHYRSIKVEYFAAVAIFDDRTICKCKACNM